MGTKIPNRVTLKICILVMICSNLLCLSNISNHTNDSFREMSVFALNILNVEIFSSSSELVGVKIGRVTTHGEASLSSYSTHLNDAIGMGATIDIISVTLTTTILNNYDIIILGNGGSSWSASELNALSSWVSSGGGLYILEDDCDAAQVSVSNKFNIIYNATPPIYITSTVSWGHPIFHDVLSFGYPWPPCNAFIDLQASTPNYTNIVRFGNQGVLIVREFGNGRIIWNVFSGILISNSYISENDHRIIGKNSWKWLAQYQPQDPSPIPNPSQLIPLLILGEEDYSLGLIIPIITIIIIGAVCGAIIIYSKTKKRGDLGKPVKSKIRIKQEPYRKKYYEPIQKTKYEEQFVMRTTIVNCPYCDAPISKEKARKLAKKEFIECDYCGGTIE